MSPPDEPTPNAYKIDVLDHGYVRLVDYMGSDLSVVRAARVSHNADWRAGDDAGSDKKLINYLWKNRHTTPFEAVTFTFEVKAPIFVLRQWHRHRTWSYNEVSARYTELPNDFYVPDPKNIGIQSAVNKQGRGDYVSDPWARAQADIIKSHCELSFDAYKTLLQNSVSRELARGVLPVNTYSRMFATVNLLNLLKFMTLRSDAHAQYEIRVYSDAMIQLANRVVPACMEAWSTNLKS